MPDAVIPGYMYAEAFILETNGFTSNNEDNYNKVKGGAQTAKNAVGNFFGWLRDKLAKFLPSFFETKFQKNCEWFDKNGEAKYQEILKAAQGTYKLPSKDKYYKFKVTFDPGKIKAYDIIQSYRNDPTKDLSGLRKELMNAFDNDNGDLAGKLAGMKGNELKGAVENAILYSSIEGQQPQTDYPLQTTDWTEIWEDMKFMCAKDQDGKFRGGKWSTDMVQLSNDLQKAVKELKPEETEQKPEQKPEQKTETEHVADSYVMSIGSDGTFMEADTNTDADKTAQDKAKRDADILAEIQDIAGAFYTVSLNTIVSNLFPNIYNNFKGVVDDYEATKKGGTDAKDQQTAQK
jgi:hypothetical protein